MRLYLLLEEAVEDEDEHPLQRVEDGEEVGHDDGRVVQEEQPERPGEAEQTEQRERSQHPRPVGKQKHLIIALSPAP